MAITALHVHTDCHQEKAGQVDSQLEGLKEKVRKIHSDSRGAAGSRTVSDMLKQDGENVGRLRARSLKCSMGLVSKQQKSIAIALQKTSQ